MSAIETLLDGLIDYAGLFPPAALDMRTAVGNYLDYRSGERAFALGRFIVDVTRLEELRDVAAGALSNICVSAIVPATVSSEEIGSICRSGLAIDSFEIKCNEPLTICRISERLPLHVEQYFEIPIRLGCSGTIDAIASVGACAKLRMGGLVPEAFPPPHDVDDWLRLVADRRVPFKATAGLHHPVRSRHPLANAEDSPQGMMHGFVNFFCAAALVYFGQGEWAEAVLAEEDPSTFRILPDCIGWRSHQWSTGQVRTIRQDFFTSYGSCSFVEPLEDLEALGWL